VVTDVGSLNGTYVNRDRIDEVLLKGGDEVQVGKYRLVYYASQHGFGGGVR
jgi:pSer/pThr/pTyr-binding forkhead associated (FHA) protein